MSISFPLQLKNSLYIVLLRSVPIAKELPWEASKERVEDLVDDSHLGRGTVG